jgi:hypothetical protein
MTEYQQQLARFLRPVSPPKILENVYTDDQVRRMNKVIERHGPWPTITSIHFDTVEELIATTTGVVPKDLTLTLDDVATARFRGFFGQNSVVYYPELEDCFYNSKFLEIARGYWGAEYAKPTMMLFNLGGPAHAGPNAHLDATTFRGIRYENSPVWLQNIMAKSGLFTDYLVKMAQVIAWWYRGENGTFTYWPDGPLEPPKRLDHPLWNRGLVVQNEVMFHRGDSVGRPDQHEKLNGLRCRSLLGYDADRGDWAITTDGEVIRRYPVDEMRLLVHWNAEVYRDMDELKKNMDHSDDLTHEMAFNRLMADMRAKGVRVADPSDPFHDDDFIRALTETYTIAPATDWLDTSAA